MSHRLRALAAALVVVSSNQSEERPSPAATVDTRHLRGIPQDGPVLGRPDAGLRIVEVADLQDRYWDAVEALYARQGEENTGYATDDFLRDALDTVAGPRSPRRTR